MNGEGISLVGPNFPFGYVGGVPPGKIPFGGADGGLETEPGTFLDYDEPANRLSLGNIHVVGSIEGNGEVIFNSLFRIHVIATAVTPYNEPGNDMVILVTTGAGAFTVNLATAVGQIGRYLIIKKVDAGVGQVTIDAAGAETIDGALTRVLVAQWNSVTIVSNGANWVIVATT